MTDLTPGIVSFYGAPGTLKSSMALTWPKPLVMYDFEVGAHRAWKLKQSNGAWLYDGQPDQVIVRRYKFPERSITSRQDRLSGWIQAWKNFTLDFYKDLQDPNVKSIVWDTATMEWSSCCDCYLEELQGQKPDKKSLGVFEYREPNSRQTTLLASPTIYGKHLVMVSHETDEYVPITFGGKPLLDDNGQPKTTTSGVKIPDGFKYTKSKADWQFKATTKTVKTTKEGERDTTVPSITIEKSGLGIDLVGLEINWFEYSKLIQMLTQLGRI